MTKADKIFFCIFGLICLPLLVLGFIDSVTMKLVPNSFNTSHMFPCVTMYYEEAERVRAALVEYLTTRKPAPTLNKLLAKGLYTLPQDRKYKSPFESPVKMQNMRIELFVGDEPYRSESFKIIVTSTEGRCPRGKALIFDSLDSTKGEWAEEWPDELYCKNLSGTC